MDKSQQHCVEHDNIEMTLSSVMSESRSVAAQGLAVEWGLTGKGTKKSFGGNGNILYLDCDGNYTTVYICQNSSKYTLKMGPFHCM